MSVVNALPQSNMKPNMRMLTVQKNYESHFYVNMDMGSSKKILKAAGHYGTEGKVVGASVEGSNNNSQWSAFVEGNSYRYLRARHIGEPKIGNFVTLAVVFE